MSGGRPLKDRRRRDGKGSRKSSYGYWNEGNLSSGTRKREESLLQILLDLVNLIGGGVSQFLRGEAPFVESNRKGALS